MNLSLAAACSLTEWSMRTLWRRLGEGALPQFKEKGRVLIPLDAIAHHLAFSLTADEMQLLEQADQVHQGNGSSEAQNELALILLGHAKPKGAFYWLKSAAEQGHADAMNLLGLCYLQGEGVPRDEAKGTMWLAKSAALGHPISRRQIEVIRTRELSNLTL